MPRQSADFYRRDRQPMPFIRHGQVSNSHSRPIPHSRPIQRLGLNPNRDRLIPSPIARHKRTRIRHNSHLSTPIAVLRQSTAYPNRYLYLYPVASHRYSHYATYVEPGKSLHVVPYTLLCAIHIFLHAHNAGLYCVSPPIAAHGIRHRL